jgi:hypothetical protein
MLGWAKALVDIARSEIALIKTPASKVSQFSNHDFTAWGCGTGNGTTMFSR